MRRMKDKIEATVTNADYATSAGSATKATNADSATKATIADKLGTNAGSATQPVYFKDGKPVVIGYTIAKSVPADAKFTDTNTTYSNMGGASTSSAGKSGLVPAPAAGATNRYLRSDGTWQVPPDTNTWRGIQNSLTSNSTTDSLSAAQGKELKTLVDGKADKNHTHAYLPTGGGTMVGNITFSNIGNANTSNKISWNGSTDGADIYYQTTASEQGNLVLNLRDDSNCYLRIAQNGNFKSYFSPNDGNFHGNVNGTADVANVANFAKETYINQYKTVNLTDLDQNTWYPVTGTGIPYKGLRRFKCDVQLNSGSKPSWSTHNSGFTAVVDILEEASGWGITGMLGEVLINDQRWINDSNKPPVGYQQMTSGSVPVWWLRGGGTYFLAADYDCTWTIQKSKYENNGQNIAPTTTYPGVSVNRAIITANLNGYANTSGVATTAVKLARGGNTSYPMTFNWSGKSGQPTCLWGGENGTDMYVYNPSNFNVNYAKLAGSVAWGNVSGKPSSYPPSSHTHDDRYYTEAEVNTKLNGKSNTGHIHDDRYYTESETDTKLGGKLDKTENAVSSTKLLNDTVQTALTGTSSPETGLTVNRVYNNGYPTNYGNVISVHGNGSGQILAGWSGTSGAVERLYYRNKRDQADANWSDWKAIAFTDDKPASVNDIGNAKSTTFAYSKDGMNYGDYTWLAGWNGYELRAVDKNQFATTEHGITASGSNYVRFGNGIQICWGYKNESNGGGTTSFAVAFNNTSYALALTATTASNNAPFITGYTTTSFSYDRHGTAWDDIQWIAVGTWK